VMPVSGFFANTRTISDPCPLQSLRSIGA